MTPADLDRWEALAAAATAGPWKAGLNGGIALVVSHDFGPGRLPRQFRADCGHFDQDRADAAFIAEARTAVPALVAEVRRLRTLVDVQGADLMETRGALTVAWREIEALCSDHNRVKTELKRHLDWAQAAAISNRIDQNRAEARAHAERAVAYLHALALLDGEPEVPWDALRIRLLPEVQAALNGR